ncbi:MAG: hypothetical protein WB974_04215, partial [Acidobacteriaceae bacterium]
MSVHGSKDGTIAGTGDAPDYERVAVHALAPRLVKWGGWGLIAFSLTAAAQNPSQVPLRTPRLNLRSPQTLSVRHLGPAPMVSALESAGVPTTLTAADFNADGAPDLVTGYRTPMGPVVTLLLGNSDAFAPRDPSLYTAAMRGRVPATFTGQAVIFPVPQSPDFLATGDFNRDGFRDLLVGTSGGGLYVLTGDGKGNLGSPRAVSLPGSIQTLDVSADGHVAVGLKGARVAILAPSVHGLTMVASYPAPAPVTSLVWGPLGGGLDLAVAAGSNVMLIYGPLTRNPQTEIVGVDFSVRALSIGDYIWDRDTRQEIAALGSDGSVRILAHGTLDTRPLTAADIPGRRVAPMKRSADTQEPVAVGPWTVARQLPFAGSVLSGPVSRAVFGSPRMLASKTSDLMLLEAGKRQIDLIDSSSTAANATVSISLPGAPIATVTLPQKIDASRDLVVLTASQVTPIVLNEGADPTFNVTTANDEDDAGACGQDSTVTSGAGPDGVLSLREAVCEANNVAGTSVINVPAGTYALSISTYPGGSGGTASSQSGELQVGIASGTNISIVGAGQNETIIEQTDGIDRIIEQDELGTGGIPVSISDLTLENGALTTGLDWQLGGGGAIFGGGVGGDDLTLTNVALSSNSVASAGGLNIYGNGGALYYGGGTLSVTSSTFSGNSAAAGAAGGAVYASADPSLSNSFTFTNSIFSGNTAASAGGALNLQLEASGAATAAGLTFTGNSVAASGGLADAIELDSEDTSVASFTMNNSRVVGNNAPGSGTGTYINGITATLDNNWWGCNSGPNNTGCDAILTNNSGTNGPFTPNYWLELSIFPGATIISPNTSTGLTADLTHNSLGAGGFSVPDGTPASFGATLGTISDASSSTTSGTGTATFNAGATTGTGGATATVDNQTAMTTINIEMLPQYVLTTGFSPAGDGTVTPASGNSFSQGAMVSISATPGPGYAFLNWTSSPDPVASPTSATTTIMMNNAEIVTAHFVVLNGNEAVWIVNGTGGLSELSGSGTPQTTTAYPGGTNGIAIDATGNLWTLGASSTALYETNQLGTLENSISSGTGGLDAPSGIAIDGNSQVWVSNAGNSSFSLFLDDGTAESPSGGFTDTSLDSPSGIAVDGGGSVWIANKGNNSLTRVLGAAAPAAPLSTAA